jgi:hypothetical protein
LRGRPRRGCAVRHGLPTEPLRLQSSSYGSTFRAMWGTTCSADSCTIRGSGSCALVSTMSGTREKEQKVALSQVPHSRIMLLQRRVRLFAVVIGLNAANNAGPLTGFHGQRQRRRGIHQRRGGSAPRCSVAWRRLRCPAVSQSAENCLALFYSMWLITPDGR